MGAAIQSSFDSLRELQAQHTRVSKEAQDDIWMR